VIQAPKKPLFTGYRVMAFKPIRCDAIHPLLYAAFGFSAAVIKLSGELKPIRLPYVYGGSGSCKIWRQTFALFLGEVKGEPSPGN